MLNIKFSILCFWNFLFTMLNIAYYSSSWNLYASIKDLKTNHYGIPKHCSRKEFCRIRCFNRSVIACRISTDKNSHHFKHFGVNHDLLTVEEYRSKTTTKWISLLSQIVRFRDMTFEPISGKGNTYAPGSWNVSLFHISL